MAATYQQPGWFTKNVFNPAVAGLMRLGVSVRGSRILAVKGRTSGEWRTTPVNLLEHGGKSYLVSPRGETQWVRNMRVAGGGELRLGKKVQVFTSTEVTGSATVPVLRDYLKHWKWEVGQFFEGVGPDAGDEQLLAIAPRHPVFEINLAAA